MAPHPLVALQGVPAAASGRWTIIRADVGLLATRAPGPPATRAPPVVGGLPFSLNASKRPVDLLEVHPPQDCVRSRRCEMQVFLIVSVTPMI